MRRPTDARPMRTGSAPNPLSSRTRTASPGIVTLAMRRTVALVIAVSDRACCEVAHAVTQFPPPAAGRPRSCGLAAARHPKPTRTTPASTPCRTAGVLAFMVAKYTDRVAVRAEIDACFPGAETRAFLAGSSADLQVRSPSRPKGLHYVRVKNV